MDALLEKRIKDIEKETSKSWEEWLTFFESINAKDLNHTKIAQAVSKQGVQDWWSQGVTVAYEQFIGRRVVGQTCDGDFSASISKTQPGNMDQTLQFWTGLVKDKKEFNSIPLKEEARTSATEKWRYWRAKLEDGSELNINIQNKADGQKSVLTINHDKLKSTDEIDQWKSYWKAFIQNPPAA